MSLIENVSCVYDYYIDSYNNFSIRRKAIIHKICKNGSFRFKFEGDKFVSYGYIGTEEDDNPRRRVRVGGNDKYYTFGLVTTRVLTEQEFRELCKYALHERNHRMLAEYKRYEIAYNRLTS